MTRILPLLFALPLAAQVIPGRYIVELSTEPVADHIARLHARLDGPEAAQHRAAIAAEQTSARNAIEAAGGHVNGSVDTVRNALFVSIPDTQAARLASIFGVTAVHPERLFRKMFDAQEPHRPAGISPQPVIANPGAGIRIGMIDTGITISHPAFNDAGFTAPSGYPLADTAADQAFTNNKVIVARSYASYFATKDPDPTAQDDDGHGTGTAMVAAGVPNAAPLETITGVAPRAYLGIYKVFGTPGMNDSATESAVLAALNDAVKDGMDIINMSFGSVPAGPAGQDPEVSAVASATAAGVIVVVSAGNSGPNPATIATPAIAPTAIAVGSISNRRVFAGFVTTSGGTFEAQAGTNAIQSAPVAGPIVDITPFDSTSLGCSTLPANSLTGAVALILRGTCNFTVKLANAQAAGAIAAVITDNLAEPLFLMSTNGSAIPASLVSQSDGATLRTLAANHPLTALSFANPERIPTTSLSSFSAAGPTEDFTIKPDLCAIGENIYTAAESTNSSGDLYDPTGYTISEGTSFSSPTVAGAAAILKQTRPGLSVAEYRSLLINTAEPTFLSPGLAASTQQSGAGQLDLSAALTATAAVSPTSISFGSVGLTATFAQSLTLTNLSTTADTFQISVTPSNPAAPAPSLSATSVPIPAGSFTSVTLQLTASGLPAGQYEGYIDVQGSRSNVVTRIPYWYAVASTTPAYVTALDVVPSASVNAQVEDAAVIRVTDASGLPVTNVTPVATVVSGGGKVLNIVPVSGYGSAVYALNVKMGSAAGTNVFQIEAGSATTVISIPAQ